jgi:hypothetical protein
VLLATILLLGAMPRSGELARSAANLPAEVAAEDAKDSGGSGSLPSMPTPNVKTDAEADGATPGVTASVSGAEAIEPAHAGLPIRPVKPVYVRPSETHGQRVAWYALAVTGHGAAAFDAWSTRRVLSRNAGVESNPLLRPFAHSSAMYAATQVSPAVMDLIGKRMMVSQNKWVRRMWWLPQAAGSGFSVFAGAHNYGLVK